MDNNEENKAEKSGRKPKSTKNKKSSTTPEFASTTEPEEEKKNKLRTSKDIYNRLKWDSESLGIDLSSVYIGYKDRFVGMCEIAFNDFHPLTADESESEIPYHRIYYFRGGGPSVFPKVGKDGEVRVREENWPPGAIFYWDRDNRQDLIFNSGDPVTKCQVVKSSKDAYTNKQVYKFNPETADWEVASNYSGDGRFSTLKEFKLLSLNILYDIYDPEIVQCPSRWPYLIDFLEDSQAEIIALQEVTKSFLVLLQSQPWVQKEYFLTDISSRCDTITPYGQIFLSKIQPARLLFSEKFLKRFIISTFVLSGRQIHIGNVHLKSDYNGNFPNVREKQIYSMVKAISEMEGTDGNLVDILIVGDTNFRLEEKIGLYSDLDLELVDAWEMLNGDATNAFTYDIDNNPLARKTSRNFRNERVDRIFVKTMNVFKPTKIHVTGKSLIDFENSARAQSKTSVDDTETVKKPDPLCLSDHFALECEFKLRAPSNPFSPSKTKEKEENIPVSPKIDADSPVYTSAVVVIPPKSFWDNVQSMRSEFDPSFARWPPHITLFFRFIPDTGANFQLASEVLFSALQSVSLFEVTLSKIGVFQHSSSCTVYLGPGPEAVEQLRTIHSKLLSLFPNCGEKDEKLKQGHVFTPHLTLGKLPTKTPDDRKKKAKLIATWKETFENMADKDSLTFIVDKICFISRNGDVPFRVRKEIYLGKPVAQEKENVLEEFVKKHKLLPISKEMETQRSEIETELQNICNLVVKEIINKEGKKKLDPEQQLATLHLTGSTFMGFHDDSSDLDFVCLGPRDISYLKIFNGLESFLTASSPGTSKLKLESIVLNTTIPIARLSYPKANSGSTFDIDLVYSNYSSSPLDISEYELSQIMTPEAVASINAVREGHKLLEIVSRENHLAYRTAVRSLKYWAHQRNIYCKTFGFLGSSWPLLVAYVIMKLQKTNGQQTLSPEEIVAAFFETFAQWKWPEPVQFQEHSENSSNKSSGKVPELMPILSPAFPYLNRNVSVTRSTRSLIQAEFKRGDQIFAQIFIDFQSKWENLVQRQDFEKSYDKYINIRVSCQDENDLKVASGILHSGKIISFIVDLEKKCNCFVQPFTKLLQNKEREPNVISAVLGLQSENKNISTAAEFLEAIENFTMKFKSLTSKFCKKNVDIEITILDQGCDILSSLVDNPSL